MYARISPLCVAATSMGYAASKRQLAARISAEIFAWRDYAGLNL